MIKILLICSIAFLTHSLFAAETLFHPLASINARTIQKGTLSLGRAPLGNLNSDFLTSSLNFGVFERLEIGTAALFYAIPEHKYNFVFKYNFYQGENFDWSLIHGETVFRTKIENNDEVEKPDIKMDSTQLAMNYHPKNSKWALGLSGTMSCGQVKSKNAMIRLYSYRCEAEHGVDLQYHTFRNQWMTIGHGKMRESGISPFESTVSGAGAAYTWFRENKFLSRPSIGLYQHFRQNLMFLFTTTFYEKR
jgi:hypothetical protein